MSSRKRLIGLFALLLSLTVNSVFATGILPTYRSGSFHCNQVTFEYVSDYIVNYRVVNADGQVVGGPVMGTTGTNSITFDLDPTQESDTVLQIQHNFSGWTDLGPATACAGTSNRRLPPPPPWQYFGSENAYGAFRFFEETPGNPVMVFLRVTNDGEGHIAFYISQKLLEQDFSCDGTSHTLYSSPDGIYSLFLRPDCHIQANVGPDFEGKMHVISFESIPPGDTTEYWTIDAEGRIAQRVIDPNIF